MLRAFLNRLKIFTTQKQSPGRWKSASRRHARLNVEQLEDRVTPSGFSLIVPPLPAETAGQSYAAMFSAAGGDGNYQFTQTAGTLPAGLSLSSSGVLSGQATVAGRYCFTVTVIDATVPGLSDSELCKLAVVPADVSTFLVSEPDAVTAGGSFTVTTTAQDEFGNTVTNFSGNEELIASDGQTVQLAAPPTFIGGTATATVTLNTADMLTLTATSGTIQGTGGSIAVNPATLSTFAVSVPGNAIAGSSFAIIINAKDAYGNTVSNFSGNVALTSDDEQTVQIAGTPTFNYGAALMMITLDTADTLLLTATSGTIQGTSGCITVSPAALSTFAVSVPGSAIADSGFAIVINAKDAYGNTVPTFSGNVTLTTSDGQAVQVAGTPTFNYGAALITITLGETGMVSLTATSGTVQGTSGGISVSNPGFNDWFSQNMPDTGLQNLARADFNADGGLSYSDMLGLFSQTEADGTVTAAELQSLQALVTTSGAAAVNMASSVQNLTYKVVDGDPANALYQGVSLGNLQAGSSATQLQELVAKWFLGEDHPAIFTYYIQSWGASSYQLASGTLFGSGGPSYQDVVEGEVGDCWLLSSFAVTANSNPAIIQGMFTDDGTVLENGAPVHVWTVRFYNNGVASYLTVDNYLPVVSGIFAFANFGQSPTNSSNVLCVALLEKAYAQLCASGWNQRPPTNAYASLNGGTATTSLPIITGGQEIGGNFLSSQSTFIAAISAGNLLTLASTYTGNSTLGIVANHDYAVLGYDSATQTFTLLNPWGWDNTSGFPGILYLTWSQINVNFSHDGNCIP